MFTVHDGLFVDLIHRGRGDVDFAYLYRAVTHRCLNRLRDRSRRAALLVRHGEHLHPTERARIDERLVSMDLVVRMVDLLDERASEIFALHFLDGIDQGQVARMLGVSRRTVVKHVGRIREALATADAGGNP